MREKWGGEGERECRGVWPFRGAKGEGCGRENAEVRRQTVEALSVS